MRLTEKGKSDFAYYTLPNSVSNLDAINKLGQIEDIEEKLNNDIPTFFEIISANEIVVRHDDKLLYIPSCDIRWESVLRGHICVILDETQYSTLYGTYYFKDYGKTWALTREELEKNG